MRRISLLVAAGLLAVSAVACSESDSAITVTPPASDSSPPPTSSSSRTSTPAGHAEFPDVVGVDAEKTDGGWRFDVTISSPYDSPERYADAWRVVGPDGTVFAVRELTHDHAGEQPFTRSMSGIEIPGDVSIVTVEGRDLRNGWGGATMDVDLTAS